MKRRNKYNYEHIFHFHNTDNSSLLFIGSRSDGSKNPKGGGLSSSFGGGGGQQMGGVQKTTDFWTEALGFWLLF